MRISSPGCATRPPKLGGLGSTLFVGQPRDAACIAGVLPSLRTCAIYDVGHMFETHGMPQLVISLAIQPLFDCLDVAHVLQLYGFTGRFRIVATGLPKPALICHDVRHACPGIDFGVLEPTDLILGAPDVPLRSPR